MRIVITKIIRENNRIIVDGFTETGFIKGKWHDDVPPVIGKTYSAELDIRRLKKQIAVSAWEEAYTKVCGDTVKFVGICEDNDEDVYYIRFDIDWLEMVEIPESEPLIKYEYVEFSADYRDIEIYPYN